MSRRWIYAGFVLLAAALVWWASRGEAPPPGDTWDRPDERVPALAESRRPWGPFAQIALRADTELAVSGPWLTGPGCAASGEELRVTSSRTEEGWVQLALTPVDPDSSCPALEVLLRPAGYARPSVQARVLLAGADRGALRNLRGRIHISRAEWDGEPPLGVSLRLQGEEVSGRPLTFEAEFLLAGPP